MGQTLHFFEAALTTNNFMKKFLTHRVAPSYWKEISACAVQHAQFEWTWRTRRQWEMSDIVGKYSNVVEELFSWLDTYKLITLYNRKRSDFNQHKLSEIFWFSPESSCLYLEFLATFCRSDSSLEVRRKFRPYIPLHNQKQAIAARALKWQK